MNEAAVWLGFLDLNAQRHGGEYAPLQPPKAVLINVTCGDLLEAV